mgnify:CR=1 FL=1
MLFRSAKEMGDSSLLQKAYQADCAADTEEAGKRDVDDSVEQVSIYMKYAGRPAVEAWNMPIGELLWHNACFLKMEGVDVPIWSPTDEMFFNQHKAERHKKLLALGAEKQKENPILTQSLAFALASVEYWEQIVSEKKGAIGKR